jgi:photosystem II stability/assembly factor-like uncharacterized protein
MNGGRTFRIVLRTARPVEQLQTVGARGALAWLDNGTALRTLDRGLSWRRYRTPIAASLDASLATWRDAFAVTGGLEAKPVVMVTHNGGVSWQRRVAPCLRPISDTALVQLVTPKLGWLVCLGQGGAGQMQKAVYRTRDSGRSWQVEAETVFYPSRFHGGISIGGYPAGISFAADGFGMLWEGRGTLYVTRDGGRNWIGNDRVAEPEVDWGTSAAALPAGRGFVLIYHAGLSRVMRLLATRDHGRTWHIVHRWR